MRWTSYSEELALCVWDKVQGSKAFWHQLEGKSYDSFNRMLQEADLICDFGFGLGLVTNLMPEHACRVHGLFWSKDVFRKAQRVTTAICLLGLRYKLARIECIVPVANRGLNKYMTKYLGFSFEGTLKNYYKTAAGFAHGNIYALIGGING